MSQGKLLFILLIAVTINRFCSWLPEHYYFDPFPLYDILNDKGENVGISLQSYFYFIANHITTLLIWLFCMHSLPKYNLLFRCFIIIEALSLIDFLIIYEHPWFHLWSYGVEFTDLKVITYSTLIILWNRGKL
jgi:hypothetical protein